MSLIRFRAIWINRSGTPDTQLFLPRDSHLLDDDVHTLTHMDEYHSFSCVFGNFTPTTQPAHTSTVAPWANNYIHVCKKLDTILCANKAPRPITLPQPLFSALHHIALSTPYWEGQDLRWGLCFIATYTKGYLRLSSYCTVGIHYSTIFLLSS